MKKRIGIVGGGQLGRMLSQAAQKLDFDVIVLDPTPNSPAGQISQGQIVAGFKDAEAIRQLASDVDFMTFEIESADAETLRDLKNAGKEIHPSPETLQIIKDKFGQKEFLRERGIDVADACTVDNAEDLATAIQTFDFPILLKARFDAYDGRGNALIRGEDDIEVALRKLFGDSEDGFVSGRLYAEKFVPFVKEIAVVAARSTDGDVKVFPVVETIHKNNICHQVIAPAQISEEIQMRAQASAAKVMNALEGVGVFGIEMFVTGSGEVLVNEIAPRVHNSGHHTIEACETSQFEQHIRAITGMSLGETTLKAPSAVMINILGERSGSAEASGLEQFEDDANTHIHIYGKLETRPERKMGHITVLGDTVEDTIAKAMDVRNAIKI